MNQIQSDQKSYRVLNDGNWMPMMGVGTLQVKDPAVCENMIYTAIHLGYRMIDTAAAYFNEEAVGRGIQRALDEGIVRREELFVITKLWVQDTDRRLVRKAFMDSLNKLNLSYIDLYLIHQPYGNYMDAWKGMEDLKEEGLVKSIGLSNFSKDKVEEIIKNARYLPAVDQIEIHPYFSNDELVSFLEKKHICPMAWGPLAEGQKNIFMQEALQNVGVNYGKSVAQVILRWHYERQIPCIPKSINEEHLKENLNILDFSLKEEEKDILNRMDLGYSEIIDHENPLTEKWFLEWKIHA